MISYFFVCFWKDWYRGRRFWYVVRTRSSPKTFFLYFASFQLIRTWILMNRILMNRILMNRVDDFRRWFQPSCFQNLCVVVSISYTWPRISFLVDDFDRWFEPGRLSNIFFHISIHEFYLNFYFWGYFINRFKEQSHEVAGMQLQFTHILRTFFKNSKRLTVYIILTKQY